MSTRTRRRPVTKALLHADDYAVVALVAAAAFVARAFPVPVVSPVVTVAAVILFPGWCVTRAIFARATPSDRVTRLVLATALGIAVSIFTGLVIDLVGLHLSTVTLLAGAVVSSVAAVAVARARGVHITADLGPIPSDRRVMWAACASAILIALGGVALAQHSTAHPDEPPFVASWLAPPFSNAADPTAATPGSRLVLPVQLQTFRSNPSGYRITATVDGVAAGPPIFTPANTSVVPVPVTVPKGKCLHRVEVTVAPELPAAPANVLTTYLAVDSGAPCR